MDYTIAPIEPRTPTEVTAIVTPTSRHTNGAGFFVDPTTPPLTPRLVPVAPQAPARRGVGRRGGSPAPFRERGLLMTLTPDQTRSLSSSFTAFSATMKEGARRPCSPVKEAPPVPMLPPLLRGKRSRT
jgi:hypothetical protein